MKKFEVGETIILDFIIIDGNENLFPQAIIFDASDSLVGDPIDLIHIGSGLYRGRTTMPNTPKLTSIYIPYDDSDQLIESELTGRDVECFFLDSKTDVLNNINTNVNSLLSQGLPGEILDGFIEDDDSTLVGYIEC